jgi:hypothetical protein
MPLAIGPWWVGGREMCNGDPAMRRRATRTRLVLVLTVLLCVQIAGCAVATVVTTAAAAMIGIVQINEALSPGFTLAG